MNRALTNKIIWILVILLSAYYFYRGIYFRFFKEGLGDTFWNKQFWYVFHISAALAPLILGPLQFWNWLRVHHIRWHRLLGKIYIIGSLFGGISALYLGITVPLEGSRLPIFLLACLWLFMTIAAWVCIKKGNIKGHRLFMIRSYVLALVFIWLRIMGDIPPDYLFFYIKSPELRDTTQEWMSWVIPLLIMEFWISWIPLLKQSNRKKGIITTKPYNK